MYNKGIKKRGVLILWRGCGCVCKFLVRGRSLTEQLVVMEVGGIFCGEVNIQFHYIEKLEKKGRVGKERWKTV